MIDTDVPVEPDTERLYDNSDAEGGERELSLRELGFSDLDDLHTLSIVRRARAEDIEDDDLRELRIMQLDELIELCDAEMRSRFLP